MARALYIDGARRIAVRSLNLGPGRPGEIMLQVAAVGICGSDLHYFKDGGIGSAIIREPFVPGHEFAGRLEDDLPAHGLAAGQLVAVDPSEPCGACEWCAVGHSNLCPAVRLIGAPPIGGAMTERIWVRPAQLVPVPDGMGPLEAVMLEPLGVAIHAIDLARPRLLERVALLGCGPIGLLVLQVLKAAGAGEVLAAEPLAHRRAHATRLGADRVTDSIAELVDWSGGGCPLVLEATNSPEGFKDAVTAARIGGRIVLVGIPDGDQYTLPASEARRRGLKIKLSRRMGEVYPRAIALVASGKIDVASIVTHRIGLDEAPAAFRNLAENVAGYGKVLVYPNGVEGE